MGLEPAVDQTSAPVCAAVVTCALAVPVLPFAEPASVRHLYWASRELAGRSGRPGTRLIDCMQAWSTWGLVPESSWPWDSAALDERPPRSLLAPPEDRHRLRIERAAEAERLPAAGRMLVDRLRSLVVEGQSFSLEFPLHPTQIVGFGDGHLPALSRNQRSYGRHVVLVTGFDDHRVARHGPRTKGAFRFLNSWGAGWGDAGRGWLPYEYALTGRVRDVWVVHPTEAVRSNAADPAGHSRPRVIRLD